LTYASCLAAAKTLLGNANLGFVTIANREELKRQAPSEVAEPAAILEQMPMHEHWVAAGVKARHWDIDIHIWRAETEPTNGDTAQNDLGDAVEQIFRWQHRLGGLADTTSTRVHQAVPHEGHPRHYLLTGVERLVRTRVVSVEVTELINAST